jgi:hypothetical protein
MADPSRDSATPSAAEPASQLDIPPERRALHQVHAATLAATARRVALAIPFSADVDDFRRVLAGDARPETKPGAQSGGKP